MAVAPDGHIISADITGMVKMWPADLSGAVTTPRGPSVCGSGHGPEPGRHSRRPSSIDGGRRVAAPELSQIVLRPGTGSLT